MRIGSRQFSPPLWALCLYLVVALCMLWLGNWQLNRAALKIQMKSAAEQASQSAAIPISAVGDIALAAANYQRVSVEGEYLVEQQFLWDNRTHKGKAGFEVISPVQLASGELVLVNRGWISLGASREQLPDVELPVPAKGQSIRIEGFASAPSRGFSSGDALDRSAAWPKLLQYFDYKLVSDVLGKPTLPVVIQAQALSEDALTPTVLTSRPEWLTANWQPAASGPAKHYSYAFQWFAMAAALTILFIVVNTRPSESSDE